VTEEVAPRLGRSWGEAEQVRGKMKMEILLMAVYKVEVI
jgi:hypothetical protein